MGEQAKNQKDVKESSDEFKEGLFNSIFTPDMASGIFDYHDWILDALKNLD
jgi:hypothetical protein